jgi:hypothetical protein
MLDVIDNWRKIGNGNLISTGSHYCYNSREKVSISEINEEIKNRPLLIPEMADILINSTWWEFFKNHWDFEDLNQSDLWLGHTDAHLGWYRRLKLVKNFKFSLEADGKSFDTRIPAFVIKKAFEILRSSWKRSKWCDNFFEFMMNGYINKFVHLPNGHVFTIKRGTPTGNVFTSMINSLCTWIMWTDYLQTNQLRYNHIGNDYRLSVQGDDIVIWSNQKFNESDILHMKDFMIRKFNYELDFKFSESSINNQKDPNNNVSFLRRVISNNMLTTRTWDIWEKLLSGPEYSGCSNYRSLYLDRRLLDIQVAKGLSRNEILLYLTYMKFVSGKEHKLREFYSLILNSCNWIWSDSQLHLYIFRKLFKITEEQWKDAYKHYEVMLSINYNNVLNTYSSEQSWFDYGYKEKPTFTLQRMIQMETGLKIPKKCNFLKSVYIQKLK